MDKFSQSSVSSAVMRLTYKYNKSLIEVLSDLNKLNEDPDIVDPLVVLEEFYNGKESERNK